MNHIYPPSYSSNQAIVRNFAASRHVKYPHERKGAEPFLRPLCVVALSFLIHLFVCCGCAKSIM